MNNLNKFEQISLSSYGIYEEENNPFLFEKDILDEDHKNELKPFYIKQFEQSLNQFGPIDHFGKLEEDHFSLSDINEFFNDQIKLAEQLISSQPLCDKVDSRSNPQSGVGELKSNSIKFINVDFRSLDSKNKEKVNSLIGKKRKYKKNSYSYNVIDDKKSIKRMHSKFDKDNIMRKVKNNYISFIVNYVNLQIKENLGEDHEIFRHGEYKSQKEIKKDTLNRFKKLNVSDIVKQKSSKKSKKFLKGFSSNEDIYQTLISENNPNIMKLLNENVIHLFNRLYKPSHYYTKIPSKIKVFEDLFNDKENKNKKLKIEDNFYRERTIKIIQKEFRNPDFPLFKVKSE